MCDTQSVPKLFLSLHLSGGRGGMGEFSKWFDIHKGYNKIIWSNPLILQIDHCEEILKLINIECQPFVRANDGGLTFKTSGLETLYQLS